MRRTLARYESWILAALVAAGCLLPALVASFFIPLPAEDDFNVVRWELRHLPNKWLYLTGRALRGGLSPEEEDERLGRFLVLSAEVRRLESRVGGTGDGGEELDRLRRERDGLENDVEAIVEGRLTAVLEEAGLDSSLPLFPDARWVFPPVDFEIGPPPRVLAVSPRDAIELVGQRPLRPGLSLPDVVEREAAAEEDGSRSALVTSVGGSATYPSVVAPASDYESLVATVAHEWVHHYLFFKPLGLRYLESVELQTLNETVADIAGNELAGLVVERDPLPQRFVEEVHRLLPDEPDLDVSAALRDLRREVDALLVNGHVRSAEALMEQRRLELAERGVFFRKINQAFFAFHNVYATGAISTDPIGGKLTELRARAGSVGAFLRQAAQVTNVEELDALLERRSR